MLTLPYVGQENFEVVNRILDKYQILQLQRGAEVGVRHGVFTKYLLLNNPKLKMTCIDPYMPYEDVGYSYTEEHQQELKAGMLERLEKFKKRVDFSFDFSTSASNRFPKEHFDFVFIDAEHIQESVLTDLKAWFPKVRQGGLLMGHDYSMDPVKEALKEFGEPFAYSEVTEGDCYWIVK